jgi:protein TonB
MLVHGLRLLVALITFAVGVAASTLLGSGNPAGCGKRVTAAAAVPVAAPLADEPPPPPHHGACSAKRPGGLSVYGGVLNGKAFSKPAPVYPQAAKTAGVSGTVVVQIGVEEDGCVSKAQAVSGPALLRAAAEEAARQARFTPTMLSGDPVRVTGVITYNFAPQ